MKYILGHGVYFTFSQGNILLIFMPVGQLVSHLRVGSVGNLEWLKAESLLPVGEKVSEG